METDLDRSIAELQSARLRLRDWRSADLPLFAALNADSRVMEHFPQVLSREQSDLLAERIVSQLRSQGWGLWAAEVAATDTFIGFVGLNRPLFQAHFTPAVEVGWRLAHQYWGCGYATEAARAALGFGFESLGLPEIVSFTNVDNQRSRRVMEKLGMRHQREDDFDHPSISEGHRLRRHVLYRLTSAEFKGLVQARRDHD
ncbi:MAG TPA: GNAT family N-acetyltransferase [Candidatus Saccharimonadales bacterium]|nr:GNAT family N-acetyltransferase [Candidatus Saccharimonadales bacterium]